MLDVAPKAPPAHVQYAAQLLTKVVSEVEIGLVTRIDENFSTRIERAYDIFVDGVWFELRDRLAFFSCYNHEGTAKLTDEDREELDFDERLEQARNASKIHDRLFADGADFLRQSFPQQAALMAARLNWLESKQLEDQLAELVTPQFITLMKVCQRRYEAMVNERSSRDGKSLADMQVLRHKLRVQLYAYTGAIGSLYDGTAESAKIVEAALRPILVLRAQARRKAGDSEVIGQEPLTGEGEELAAGENELAGELEDGPADEG